MELLWISRFPMNLNRLVNSLERQQANVIVEIFHEIDELELNLDLKEAQNIYFNKIYTRIIEILDIPEGTPDKKFIQLLLDIGSKLNINTEFYKAKLN